MNRLVINIFFSIFIIIGCDKNSVSEQTDYVPGQILVVFEDSVTAVTANNLISYLDLEYERLRVNTTFKWGVVLVPIGNEQYWVDELPKYEIVHSAQLNHYVTLREWENKP